MGIIAQSLTQVSSYAAKKTDLWPSLMDRLTDCILPGDVDAFERHVMGLGLQVPAAWEEPLAELVAKRRAEIAEDDISEIMKRFDF
jgi:hypothetical protein